MKTKKYLLLLASLLSLTGCKNNDTPKEDKPKTVVINSFDNNDDLYRSKQLLDKISYGVDCLLTISNEQFHSGSGSLHLSYNNSTHGQIYQRNALSPIKDRDMSDVAIFGGWFYNDNDFETSLSLNVVGKETEVLSTYEVKFPAKEWINIEYKLNKVAMDAIKDDVRGFSFKIGKCSSYPASFYADEMYVTFGNKTTTEDDEYLKEIDSINAAINELPEIISVNDEVNIAKCKAIAKRYSNLPSIYRPAVTNYQTYILALQTYVESVADKTATNSDVIAYHFDTCFGLGQTSFSYTQTEFPISISNDMKFGDEEGSLKLSFNGRAQWSEFYATSAVNMQDYDYLEFSIYNNTPSRVAFCLTWDTTHFVEKGSWTTFKVSTNYGSFIPTYLIEWEFTGNDRSYYGDDDAHALSGDLYISQVRLHRASAAKFVEMLDALPAVIDEKCEAQVTEIRNYFDNLHVEEKAKISADDYARLLKAEYDVSASYFAKLGSMIDALPSAKNIKAYHGTHINKAYSIYLNMSDNDKATYLSKSQCDKLEELYLTYSSKYEIALDASKLAGENVGISWDVRANVTKKVDETYGDIAEYKLSSIPQGGLNGAFEQMFGNVDTSDYQKVTFFVKPAHDDTLYISRSAWRGGDSNKGYVHSQILSANKWNEVVIDAKDFGECSYLTLYLDENITLGDTYLFTSYYGVY